jgi:hypothetical protein
VRCSTSHGLAYRALGSRFKARLDASQHMPLWRTAHSLASTATSLSAADDSRRRHWLTW